MGVGYRADVFSQKWENLPIRRFVSFLLEVRDGATLDAEVWDGEEGG